MSFDVHQLIELNRLRAMDFVAIRTGAQKKF